MEYPKATGVIKDQRALQEHTFFLFESLHRVQIEPPSVALALVGRVMFNNY